ncbi:hypothetical protein M569_08501, partial [Genlisea aurea]
LRFEQFLRCSPSAEAVGTGSSPEFAVLLEVEGVLMDVNRLVIRQAFNAAFKKLGLDCANWAEPVYLDLLRRSAGDEERMLILYFNRIGWPSFVSSDDKQSFVKKVVAEKKNAVDDLVQSKALSLRPGAQEFIDEACKEGIPVVLLTSYCPRGENVGSSIVQKLGDERMSTTQVIGNEQVKRSSYGQLVLGRRGASANLDEQLAKEATEAASAERQRIADAVASLLNLRVELNTTSVESMQNVVAALRAGAESAGVEVDKCVLIAGSQIGLSAAERIGMACVVLRSRSTARAEFPSAVGVMEGYGGADLTISRLRKLLVS